MTKPEMLPTYECGKDAEHGGSEKKFSNARRNPVHVYEWRSPGEYEEGDRAEDGAEVREP